MSGERENLKGSWRHEELIRRRKKKKNLHRVKDFVWGKSIIYKTKTVPGKPDTKLHLNKKKWHKLVKAEIKEVTFSRKQGREET